MEPVGYKIYQHREMSLYDAVSLGRLWKLHVLFHIKIQSVYEAFHFLYIERVQGVESVRLPGTQYPDWCLMPEHIIQQASTNPGQMIGWCAIHMCGYWKILLDVLALTMF